MRHAAYGAAMPTVLHVRFEAGEIGRWSITSIAPVTGEDLPAARALDLHEGPTPGPAANEGAARTVAWALEGVVSNERYVERAERTRLMAHQEGLGRTAATRAALIPIRKASAWWELTQDERRGILEHSSHHIAIGLDYLPAVARRLHHCRDLGGPFDFLTWFEYAPSAAGAFEELVGRLRETEEWTYVDREVDVRLHR